MCEACSALGWPKTQTSFCFAAPSWTHITSMPSAVLLAPRRPAPQLEHLKWSFGHQLVLLRLEPTAFSRCGRERPPAFKMSRGSQGMLKVFVQLTTHHGRNPWQWQSPPWPAIHSGPYTPGAGIEQSNFKEMRCKLQRLMLTIWLHCWPLKASKSGRSRMAGKIAPVWISQTQLSQKKMQGCLWT